MLFGWTISRGLESEMMSRIIFFAVMLVVAQGSEISAQLLAVDGAAESGPRYRA